MAMPARPVRDRVYHNHHLDSRRWDRIALRDGDIVISTSYKTGTTWMQRIASLLVFGPGPLPATLLQLSPWIDARFQMPLEVVVPLVEGQAHRRFLKSHLPLDALPYDERIRYLVVGRDGRDVFMSLWNHYGAYTDALYERLNGGDDFAGEPIPRRGDDIHAVFRDWIGRASFPWEQDGYPMWSHFYHAQSFWRFRRLPNIQLVHFADLKADLEGEMRRIAHFLGIAVPEAQWPELVRAASFETMKRDAELLLPEMALGFEGGAKRFIHKGTNGRWRDVLAPDELADYEKAVARAVEPACAAWLERGRAAGDPRSL
jgi:aryl sulfotransferase